MTAGTPAGALIDTAEIRTCGRSVSPRRTHRARNASMGIEMTLQAERVVALGEHLLVQ